MAAILSRPQCVKWLYEPLTTRFTVDASIQWSHLTSIGIPMIKINMMTSSNRNIFRVTGHLCEEFTGPRWIPRTKASDAELWCFLWFAPRPDKWLSKQSWGWWSEMPSSSLWRNRNETASTPSEKLAFILRQGPPPSKHGWAMNSWHLLLRWLFISIFYLVRKGPWQWKWLINKKCKNRNNL